MRDKRSLLHFGLVLSSIIVMGGVYWDAYWHVANGRETFFSLPHLTAIFGVVLAFGLLYALKGDIPLLVWGIIPLLLFSAWFDNWWHINIRPDTLSDPFFLWTPPHLLLLLSLLALLFVIASEVLNTVLFTPAFAALSTLVFLMVEPLDLLGPYFALGSIGGILPVFTAGFLVHTYFKLGGKRVVPYFLFIILIAAPLAFFKDHLKESFGSFVHLPYIPFTLLFVFAALLVDTICYRNSILRRTQTYTFLYVILFYGSHVLFMKNYAPYSSIVFVYALLAIPLSYLASKASDHFVAFFLHVGHHHLRSKQVKKFISLQ